MTILDKIIAEKRKEVAALKLSAGENRAEPSSASAEAGTSTSLRKGENMSEPASIGGDILPKKDAFSAAVRKKNTMSIIAEIKRASPSKGMINADVDPVKQAKIYAESGASAISVLTDTPFFKGTMDDLRAVRAAVNMPILCKDFMIDPIQIDRAKAAGANIILLIAAVLDDAELTHMYDYAREQGLEVLCEVHDEVEMERVLKVGAEIIGINNRNLKTFEVDLETTARLARFVTDPDTILVSESGIETAEDVALVAEAGARVILVGETFMRAAAVGETMQSFQIPLPGAGK